MGIAGAMKDALAACASRGEQCGIKQVSHDLFRQALRSPHQRTRAGQQHPPTDESRRTRYQRRAAATDFCALSRRAHAQTQELV